MRRSAVWLAVFIGTFFVCAVWWFLETRGDPVAQPPSIPEVALSEAEHRLSTSLSPSPKGSTFEEKLATVHKFIRDSNVPINFHGLVVDKMGAPLSGAEVIYRIRENKPVANSSFPLTRDKEGRTTSGEKGAFAISGVGELISITGFVKPGYKWAPFRPAIFNYAGNSAGAYRSDKDRPETFTLIDEGSAAKVHRRNGRVRLSTEGTAGVINLAEAPGNRDATVLVKFRRAVKVTTAKVRPADWDGELAVPEGGLVEDKSGAVYYAPESGYLEAAPYPKEPQRSGDPRQVFLLRTKNGNFARIGLTIYPEDQGDAVRCSFDVWYNVEPGNRLIFNGR